MLEIRLLGKFAVTANGHPVELPLRAAQSLLAYLALTPGSPHRREQLIGLLWPEADEASARRNLRQTLWRLRKALGSPEVILADDLVVTFDAPTNYWLDAQVVARKLPAEASADDLIAAVSAYGGELLPGFYDDWVMLERERLQAAFEQKMNTLLDRLLVAQRWADVLEWAERWIALGHTPEAAFRALITAHGNRGDVAGAAAVYRRCVEALQTDLGVEPSAQTRAAYARWPQGGGSAQTIPAAPASALPRSVQAIFAELHAAPKTNLPAPLSSFVGREKEIAQIRQSLRERRLVTLIGPGGIGKTRLSVQAAGELVSAFPDGVWHMEFAPLADPALVPQTVRAVLGLREEKERPLLTVLTDYVRDRNLLLVFDNCEHLIDACAQLAETLLRAGPGVRVLATSREALGITGEMALQIPPLTLPGAQTTQRETLLQSEAGQLFSDRAETALPGFVITGDNAPAIAEMCRRLDGIPLALELAAARVKMLRVKEIAARLDDRFRLLTGGSRTALPRHQTLRALIDWSYDLLTEPERTLLRRLSVFAGGWMLEAAEAVCGGDGVEVSALLEQLVNKSLVVIQRRQGADTRYVLLETLRQYAREKLLETGEAEALSERHLQFFAQLAEAMDAQMRGGPGLKAGLDCLETEHANLLAALDWALENGSPAAALAGLRLSGAAWDFWHLRGHAGAGRERLTKLLALPNAQAPSLPRAKALRGLIFLLCEAFGEPGPALQLAEETVALWREVGSQHLPGYADALNYIGILTYRQTSDKAGGRALVEEGLALARASGDKIQIGWILLSVGLMALDEGRLEEAQAWYTESLVMHRQAQLPIGVASLLIFLDEVALLRGQDWAAHQMRQEEALRLLHDLGEKSNLAITFWVAGCWEYSYGHYDDAQLYAAEGLEMARGLENRWLVAMSTSLLGWTAYHRGDLPQARQQFLQGLYLLPEQARPLVLIHSLAGSSALAAAEADWTRAAQLLSAAERLCSAASTPITDLNFIFESETSRLRRTLQESLGDAAFAEAWTAGEGLSVEDARAYALEVLKPAPSPQA